MEEEAGADAEAVAGAVPNVRAAARTVRALSVMRRGLRAVAGAVVAAVAAAAAAGFANASQLLSRG